MLQTIGRYKLDAKSTHTSSKTESKHVDNVSRYKQNMVAEPNLSGRKYIVKEVAYFQV